MSQMEIFYKRIDFRQNRPSDRVAAKGYRTGKGVL